VELVMAFEKEFDIDIPDEDAEKLRTPRGICRRRRATPRRSTPPDTFPVPCSSTWTR
jgi:hypothetical protein